MGMAMVGVTVLELHILPFLPQLLPHLPKHLQPLMSERSVMLIVSPRLMLILKPGMDTIMVMVVMDSGTDMAGTMADTTDIPDMDMDTDTMENKQIKPKC